MFIPEEEHDCNSIVQLVHLVEIGHFVYIAEIDDGEVFDLVGDACCVHETLISFSLPTTLHYTTLHGSGAVTHDRESHPVSYNQGPNLDRSG